MLRTVSPPSEAVPPKLGSCLICTCWMYRVATAFLLDAMLWHDSSGKWLRPQALHTCKQIMHCSSGLHHAHATMVSKTKMNRKECAFAFEHKSPGKPESEVYSASLWGSCTPCSHPGQPPRHLQSKPLRSKWGTVH